MIIDNKLSYDEYISTCLKQASAKMNSIKRLGNFISKKQKKILCYSYVLSYFKYCPIVWHFGNISNIHKTEKLHERVIRFIHSDYDTEYFTLLKNLSLRTLYAERLKNICIEVYKIKNEINPKYINELITERPSQHKYRKPLDLLIHKSNQITFGYKSFRTLAPIVWNTLPAEIQALTKLDEFKTKIDKIEFAWCSCIKCCEKQKQVQQNL